MALESEDQEQIATAVKDVLTACILTRGIKVEKLSTFDIEYLFLNVRGKSVGETIDVLITCEDDGETKVSAAVSIDEIQVVTDPNHKKDIKVDDTLTLRMKYPSLTEFINQNFTGGADLDAYGRYVLRYQLDENIANYDSTIYECNIECPFSQSSFARSFVFQH